MQDNLKGATIMTVSMTAFTLNDACMKAVLVDLPLFEVMFLRGIGTTITLIALCLYQGQFRQSIPAGDRTKVWWRTAAEIGATFAFLTALSQMKLANLSAVLQALPLTVALAAAIFLKEPIGWRRFLAIAIGFVGVLMILRPGVDGFDRLTLVALMAVGFVTIRDILARQITKQTPSTLVALYSSVAVLCVSAVGLFGISWVALTPSHIAYILGSVVFLVVGYIAAVAAMRVGEIAVVTPFRYTSLLVALLLGWVFFDEWPDGYALIGASIVVLMGLFTLYRERKLRQNLAKQV